MGVNSTEPTSRRGYLSQSELAQLANITITDTTEADDRINQAEELIDAYVGAQNSFMCNEVTGRATAGASTTITLQTSQQNTYQQDYFKLCEIEIIGGTGAGQRRKITGNTYAGVITIDSAWTVNPDSTSFYKIYQLGKFPRREDVYYYSESTPNSWYKSIPEEIKRAVAAQVEYIIQMGDAFFASNKATKKSESIGDYSYSGSGDIEDLISPKAKTLLSGFMCRIGKLIV